MSMAVRKCVITLVFHLYERTSCVPVSYTHLDVYKRQVPVLPRLIFRPSTRAAAMQ